MRNVSSSAERVRVRSDCFSNFQDEVRRRIVTYHSAVVQTKAEIFSEAQSCDETLYGLDWVVAPIREVSLTLTGVVFVYEMTRYDVHARSIFVSF